MQWAIFIQEGFGSDGQHVYFTNEAPEYESERIPVLAVAGENVKAHVGDRDEMFIVFTPVNGPSKRRGKPNRIPFARVLSVVQQESEDAENV